MYSIYRYSKNTGYTPSDVVREIMEGIQQNCLTKNLNSVIIKLTETSEIDIEQIKNGSWMHDSWNGSWMQDSWSYQKDNILFKMLKHDENFRKIASDYYSIRKGFKFYNLGGDYDNVIKYGEKIDKLILDKEPYPMINRDLAIDFYKNDKSDSDVEQLAMHIAIHSILGKKSFCKTNKELIVSRMLGYASKNDIQGKVNEDTEFYYYHYLNRYHFDRVLRQLEMNWHIVTFSKHIRGIYIGNGSKISRKDLIMKAEQGKIKNKIKQLQKEKNEAYTNALKSMNEGGILLH